MRHFVTLLTVLGLLSITFPAGASPAEDPLVAWLDARARDVGFPAFDVDGLTVERRVVDARGAVTTSTLTGEAALAHLAASPAMRLVGADAPRGGPLDQDGVLGSVTHLMFQILRCDGYDVRFLREDVARVRGSWDLGFHVPTPVLATVAGLPSGHVVPPGVDPQGGVGGAVGVTLHLDTSLWGVGQLTGLTETRAVFFGFCLLTTGTFAGTGAWLFDGLAPAVPAEPAALTAR